MNETRHRTRYASLKIGGDLTLGLLLLVGFSPLFLALAFLIWLEDGQPVFFRQTRSGLHGEPFEIIKFRTMRQETHNPEDPLSLVTRTGRFLRRWGLDELPQLWNVLRGEMSLVGPRPTLPEQVARYGAFEKKRLEMRPGLTGWAQITGRNALSWPERIQRDVWYVEHASLLLDLKILLRTPLVLLQGKGVYGTGNKNPDYPMGQ